jgi:hypothetical protein
VKPQVGVPSSRKQIGRRIALLYFVAGVTAAIPIGGPWAYYLHWLGDAFGWWTDTKEIVFPEVALFLAAIGSLFWLGVLAGCTHELAHKRQIDPWGAALYGILVGLLPGLLVGTLPVAVIYLVPQ